jgi:hypothetical protein
MADPTDNTDTALTNALISLLTAPSNAMMEQARTLLAQRLALTGGIVPSRIPAPLNITEIGGYLNLLEDANQPELRLAAITAALGIAGPIPPGVFTATPPLLLSARSNRADDAALDAAVPRSYRVRSDFAASFDAAMQSIEDRGGDVQWLDLPLQLPAFQPGATLPADVMPFLGRAMTIVPGSALRDPATDRIALGSLVATDPPVLIARVTDPSAPQAGTITAQAWTVWTCNATACAQAAATDAWFEVAPLLGAAGWAATAPQQPPTSNAAAGNVFRFVNTTGLVAGTTTLRDELALLWPAEQINASALRDIATRVWNGSEFV